MKKIAIVVCLLAMSSCWFVKKEGLVIVDCTIQAVESHAKDLLPAVLAILHGEAPNWAAQLDALKSLGEDVLACALGQASMQLEAEAEGDASQPTAGPEALKAKVTAIRGRDRASSYMKGLRHQAKCASPASLPAGDVQ